MHNINQYLKLISFKTIYLIVLPTCIFFYSVNAQEGRGIKGGDTEKLVDKKRILSIEDSINIALSENPDIAAGKARIEAALAKMAQARAAFMPKLVFENEYMRMDAPQYVFSKTIDSRMISFSADFNNPRPLDNYETGLSMRYNLYRGGKDWQGLKQAEIAAALKEQEHYEFINRLVFLVINYYYDVLAAKDQIKVAEDSLETIHRQLKHTQILYDGGAALKADLFSLAVRQSEAKERLLAAQNGYELARVSFATLLGLSSKPSFTLNNELWQPAELPETVEEGIDFAFSNRSIIKVAQHAVNQAKTEVKKAKGSYLPEVNLWSRYYFDDDDFGYDGGRKNWVIAARIEWTLFDGFLTKKRVQESKAAKVEAKANMQKTMLNVEKEVRSAYLNLSEVRAKLDVATSNEELAQESLRLVKISYDNGAADVTRYLDAELDLTRARTILVKTKYELRKSIANCFSTLGYCGLRARGLIKE